MSEEYVALMAVSLQAGSAHFLKIVQIFIDKGNSKIVKSGNKMYSVKSF